MVHYTSVPLSYDTRDRLYYLKGRKSYDRILTELMDMYERQEAGGDPAKNA